MKKLRSIGLFLLTGGALCGLMAYERYRSAVMSAEKIADSIDGFELESVQIPIETIVSGLIAVTLLVAGINCLFESRRHNSGQAGDGQL